MFEVFLYALAIMFASLAGILFVWGNMGQFLERNLSYLVSFSAGVFLVVTYLLASEAIEEAPIPAEGFLWILVGMVGIWVFFRFLPEMEHHHDESMHHTQEGSIRRIDPRRILISDGIHNIADGILLAASFIISASLGAITALSIFIHELLQGISEFFILRRAGFSTKKALSINFVVASTILIGALGGFYLIENFRVLEIPLLGIAAGAFLIVVLYDLIPHSLHHAKTYTQYIKHILWFALGIILMFFVSTWVAPSHAHEEEGVGHSSEMTEVVHKQ